MALRRIFLVPVVSLCVFSMILSAGSLRAAEKTALDEYVSKPDPTYQWKVVKTVDGGRATTFIVDLKSQSWRTKDEVNQTVWRHWLVVVKPKRVSFDKAFLFIGGGRNGRGAPNGASRETQRIAALSNSVVAELRMVPNQPLIFNGDGVERSEDDLVAYTWVQYLKTGDATWPARMPMVKSAVRAMDCVQELLGSQQGGNTRIDEFVVAGGSKRGWTTWLTAAVDPRVVAIVPIVIDVLNVDPSMRHHYAAYGFWAPAVGDYVRHRIMDHMGTAALAKLYDLVDPYSYRDRLTMPKYIVNASGDQFFLPDSSQFYYDDLKGEKYLRYVPNADHSLKGTDALESIVAFYSTVLTGAPRPEYSWTMEDDGSIRVETKDRRNGGLSASPTLTDESAREGATSTPGQIRLSGGPKKVTLWQATNPDARDFRVETAGKIYTSRRLEDQGGGVYVANVETPKKGWTAFFVELEYETGTRLPLKLTTAVRVVPETLPYAGKLSSSVSDSVSE